ncbi:MAG: hypothetical protein R3F07_04000 [Opitutaceae bacterium]
MNSKDTPEIFSTLKKLSDDKKQLINNYVRETHGRPNVAIWAVKSNAEEQEELNSQINAALESGDWSHFSVGKTEGPQTPTVKDNEPQSDRKVEKADSSPSRPPSESEVFESVTPGFGDRVRQLIDAEIDRRVADVRVRVRSEVIAELRLCG